MKKVISMLFVINLLLVSTCWGTTIYFERDNNIYQYDTETDKETFVVRGWQPCISSDGKMLAYSIVERTKKHLRGIDPHTMRTVGILDLATKKVFRLDSLIKDKTGNSRAPITDNLLLFHILDEKSGADDKLGLLNLRVTDIKGTRKKKKKFVKIYKDKIYEFNWYGQDKIITHNMGKILILDKDLNIIGESPNKKIAKLLSSSTDEIYFDSKQKTYYVIAYNPKSQVRVFGEEPGNCIYRLEKNKLEIITPNNFHINNLSSCFDTNEIYFDAIIDKQNTFSIYKINLKDRKIKKVIENAHCPSVFSK